MLPLVLVLAFLLTPIVEIFTIIQVGHAIGAWPTVGLLAAETLLGAWIVRREGRRAWRALQEALQRGSMPEHELGDAALVLAGGALIMIPGFVTDVVGLLFVLPFTRPLVRRALAGYAARRVRQAEARSAAVFPQGLGGGLGGGPGGGFGPFGPGPAERDGGATPAGPVVRGEVVHDTADEDERPSRT
ncbi:FxsA family protein [Actinomadura fibrosa]|uniref:FxsA family protein n=1 Tax=Actinomadura fibrosa TaxID=111802 RepID=A0ABW2XV81_9ACTN|nr:FxsA family protein [Actinomadura fibrosa]